MSDNSEEYATKVIEQSKEQLKAKMKDFNYEGYVLDNLPYKLKVHEILDREDISHVANGLRSLVSHLLGETEAGDFLKAVLKEDLADAFGRADATNEVAMKVYCTFLYNQVPVALR